MKETGGEGWKGGSERVLFSFVCIIRSATEKRLSMKC